MPVTPINDLLSWVVTRWKPSVAQVKAWMGSYWHKDELIPANKIDGLNLNAYVTITQLNALAASLVPIQGAVNGYVLITFTQRTTVREIEIESQVDGTAKIGVDINDNEFGEVDYIGSAIATILVNRVFKQNEGLYISTTTAANFIIRKA